MLDQRIFWKVFFVDPIHQHLPFIKILSYLSESVKVRAVQETVALLQKAGHEVSTQHNTTQHTKHKTQNTQNTTQHNTPRWSPGRPPSCPPCSMCSCSFCWRTKVSTSAARWLTRLERDVLYSPNLPYSYTFGIGLLLLMTSCACSLPLCIR